MIFDINYVELFKNIPPELSVLIISMLPIAELRVAIPIALGAYKLNIFAAYIFSVLGNIVPIFFILYFIDPVSKYLMGKFKIFNRFFTWLFERTRIKFTKKSVKYGGIIALVLFVAVPLPVTGAWTGSLAAFLFQIPKRYAIPAIIGGVMIAGIIVSIITLGILNLI